MDYETNEDISLDTTSVRDDIEAPVESDCSGVNMDLESDETSGSADLSETNSDSLDDVFIGEEDDLTLVSDEITDSSLETEEALDLETGENDDMTLDSDDLEIEEPTQDEEEAQIETHDDQDNEKPNYFEDREKLSGILEDFQGENWEQMSIEDQKEAISHLADYNSAVLGIENKPNVEFYSNDNQGDFGGYSESDNTVYVNEANLSDPIETVDTISHEFRHAYQHERALNPISDYDYQIRDNFENYVDPSRDYAGYQEQLVESDAREYAQGFKDFMNKP